MLKLSYRVLLLVSFLPLGLMGAYQAEGVQNGGTIEGVVKPGGRHSKTKFVPDVDQDACEDKVALDNVVTGPGGGLKNVIVYIIDVNRGKGLESQSPVALLTHKKCLFYPRVQVVPVGTLITLKNEDPVAHNFHATLDKQSLFNVSLPLRGQKTERVLSDPGLVRVECEKHRWERAWIFVTEHPYATVTDDSGQFVFKDVPPGNYKVRVWHEGWKQTGERGIGRVEFEPVQETQTVTVQAGQVATVRFSKLGTR